MQADVQLLVAVVASAIPSAVSRKARLGCQGIHPRQLSWSPSIIGANGQSLKHSFSNLVLKTPMFFLKSDIPDSIPNFAHKWGKLLGCQSSACISATQGRDQVVSTCLLRSECTGPGGLSCPGSSPAHKCHLASSRIHQPLTVPLEVSANPQTSRKVEEH